MKQKKTKTPRRQLDYQLNYEKDAYKKIMIRLRRDNGDLEDLEKVLKDKNMNIREYVMYHVKEDLRGIK